MVMKRIPVPAMTQQKTKNTAAAKQRAMTGAGSKTTNKKSPFPPKAKPGPRSGAGAPMSRGRRLIPGGIGVGNPMNAMKMSTRRRVQEPGQAAQRVQNAMPNRGARPGMNISPQMGKPVTRAPMRKPVPRNAKTPLMNPFMNRKAR